MDTRGCIQKREKENLQFGMAVRLNLTLVKHSLLNFIFVAIDCALWQCTREIICPICCRFTGLEKLPKEKESVNLFLRVPVWQSCAAPCPPCLRQSLRLLDSAGQEMRWHSLKLEDRRTQLVVVVEQEVQLWHSVRAGWVQIPGQTRALLGSDLLTISSCWGQASS